MEELLLKYSKDGRSYLMVVYHNGICCTASIFDSEKSIEHRTFPTINAAVAHFSEAIK